MDKWEAGNAREQKIKDLFSGWGFDVYNYGFEALSNKFTSKHPIEKGKPDFLININGNYVFFEVTGTNKKSILEKHDIWIRPDKVNYVKKYDIDCYCVHILDHLDLIRFVDMRLINRDNTPVIFPRIRGNRERYFGVSSDRAISINVFKDFIIQNYKIIRDCIRCGYCCKKSTCPLGMKFDSPPENCTFLGGDKPGFYYCRFVSDNIVDDAKTMIIDIGGGCCSPLNSDRLVAFENIKNNGGKIKC